MTWHMSLKDFQWNKANALTISKRAFEREGCLISGLGPGHIPDLVITSHGTGVSYRFNFDNLQTSGYDTRWFFGPSVDSIASGCEIRTVVVEEVLVGGTYES